MTTSVDFDDIRSYTDEEFPTVRDKLIDQGLLEQLVPIIAPNVPVEVFKETLQSINKVLEFQVKIIYPAVQQILSVSSDGFSHSGLEKLDKNKSYLFISNHRDIVLDPALLNISLVEAGLNTAEIAIGDNLLKASWIEDLVRINKSFIVKRQLSSRELVLSSKVLSAYIRDTLLHRNNSVWIAQRQGRAKDGDDRTQPGLLNMVLMAAEQSNIPYLSSLNVVPVSISYEKDPCAADKVNELFHVKFKGGYEKGENEDFESMKKGIMGQKGKIHMHFGDPLTEEIDKFDPTLHKNNLIEELSQLIDSQIISNYRLFKSNFIAYDLFYEDSIFRDKYTWEERDAYISEAENSLKDLPGFNSDHLSIFYKMNAQPIINKLELEQV